MTPHSSVLRPGAWCCAVALPDGFGLVRADAGHVVLSREPDGEPLADLDTGQGIVHLYAMGASDRAVLALWQVNGGPLDGTCAWTVLRPGVAPLMRTYGRLFAQGQIEWDAPYWVVYAPRDPGTYEMLVIDQTGDMAGRVGGLALPNGDGGSGFSWVVGHEPMTYAQHGWLDHTECGGVTVEQHPIESDRLMATAGGVRFSLPAHWPTRPHLAGDAEHGFAVSYYSMRPGAGPQSGLLVVRPPYVADPPAPVEPPLPVIVAPIARPVWLGYFKVAGRYRDDAHPTGCHVRDIAGAGNCACVFTDGGDCDLDSQDPVAVGNEAFGLCRSLGLGAIVAAGRAALAIAAPYWDIVVAIYVTAEGQGLDTWAEQITHVEQLAARVRADCLDWHLPWRPILAYFDGDISRGSWRMPAGVDWIGLQTYVEEQPNIPMTLQVGRAKIDRQLAVVPRSVGVALATQAYDRSGAWHSATTLAALQSIYAPYVAADSRIKALLRFAWARPGGTKGRPDLYAWHEAELTAMGGARPAIENREEDMDAAECQAIVGAAETRILAAIEARVMPPPVSAPDVGQANVKLAQYAAWYRQRKGRDLSLGQIVHLCRLVYVEYMGDAAARLDERAHQDMGGW